MEPWTYEGPWEKAMKRLRTYLEVGGARVSEATSHHTPQSKRALRSRRHDVDGSTTDAHLEQDHHQEGHYGVCRDRSAAACGDIRLSPPSGLETGKARLELPPDNSGPLSPARSLVYR